MKLTVNLGENSYPIYIENGILTKAGSYISKLFTGKRIMVISDGKVQSVGEAKEIMPTLFNQELDSCECRRQKGGELYGE